MKAEIPSLRKRKKGDERCENETLAKTGHEPDLTKIKPSYTFNTMPWSDGNQPQYHTILLLHPHFPSNTFSLPNTPIAQDTSAHTHPLSIEAYFGGPDHMAASAGIAANASMVSAQLGHKRYGLGLDASSWSVLSLLV